MPLSRGDEHSTTPADPTLPHPPSPWNTTYLWQIHLARENQKLSFNFGSFNSVAPHPNTFFVFGQPVSFVDSWKRSLFPWSMNSINWSIRWVLGYGSIAIDTFLMGWTSIYQLFWGSLGRVLTHPRMLVHLQKGNLLEFVCSPQNPMVDLLLCPTKRLFNRLVVWNMLFSIIYGMSSMIILPIDELICFKMAIAPPSRFLTIINHIITIIINHILTELFKIHMLIIY